MVDQNSDISLGEIYRKQIEMSETLKSLISDVTKRHHDLRSEVNGDVGRLQTQMLEHIGPVAVMRNDVARHETRLDQQATELHEQATKLDDVRTQAARVSGAGALLAFLFTAIPWRPWNH